MSGEDKLAAWKELVDGWSTAYAHTFQQLPKDGMESFMAKRGVPADLMQDALLYLYIHHQRPTPADGTVPPHGSGGKHKKANGATRKQSKKTTQSGKEGGASKRGGTASGAGAERVSATAAATPKKKPLSPLPPYKPRPWRHVRYAEDDDPPQALFPNVSPESLLRLRRQHRMACERWRGMVNAWTPRQAAAFARLSPAVKAAQVVQAGVPFELLVDLLKYFRKRFPPSTLAKYLPPAQGQPRRKVKTKVAYTAARAAPDGDGALAAPPLSATVQPSLSMPSQPPPAPTGQVAARAASRDADASEHGSSGAPASAAKAPAAPFRPPASAQSSRLLGVSNARLRQSSSTVLTSLLALQGRRLHVAKVRAPDPGYTNRFGNATGLVRSIVEATPPDVYSGRYGPSDHSWYASPAELEDMSADDKFEVTMFQIYDSTSRVCHRLGQEMSRKRRQRRGEAHAVSSTASDDERRAI